MSFPTIGLASPDLDPKRIIHRYIHHAFVQRRWRYIAQLVHFWYYTPEIVAALASYWTDGFVQRDARGRPSLVLFDALDRGLDGFIAINGQSIDFEPRTFLALRHDFAAAMNGVLDELTHRLNGVRITAGDEIWTPLAGVPLGPWLAERATVPLALRQEAPTEEQAARLRDVLLATCFPPSANSVIAWAREFDWMTRPADERPEGWSEIAFSI